MLVQQRFEKVRHTEARKLYSITAFAITFYKMQPKHCLNVA